MTVKVEISHKTIIFTVLFLIFLWFLLQVKTILFLILVAFILMSALKPFVDRLDRWHIPRPLSILLLYILIIGSLGFIASTILPALVTESIRLLENLPEYIKSALPSLRLDTQFLPQQLASLGENLFKITLSLFSNLITFFTIFVVTFYLLIERRNLETFLSRLIGQESAAKFILVLKKIEERMGLWVRGEATLALSIGILTYIGLILLGVPYALPLSIFAGVLEIIPNIGPIVAAIPAILVTLVSSPLLAITVAALYFVIQQVENHLVVPFVMKRVVGLPPLVTILALMVGAQLAGIVGALMSVPIVVTAETIITEYLRIKEPLKKSTEAHKPDSVLR